MCSEPGDPIRVSEQQDPVPYHNYGVVDLSYILLLVIIFKKILSNNVVSILVDHLFPL
jgi:hypothetical protein